MRWVHRPALVAAALVALTLVAYRPALDAGFVWDDDANITGNSNMGSLDGLGRIWLDPRASQQYYPLTHTSFWLEHALWGAWAPPFHVTNVLLHAASAFLLWLLLRRLAVPGALFVALVFALHPVHVESVAWVTERKNVLCGLFALAAALAWTRWLGGGEAGLSAGSRRRALALSLIAFVLALMAKTAVAPLPLVLLALAWWKRPGVAARDLVALAPFFVLAVAAGGMTLWLETGHVGAGGEWDLSFGGRLILAGRAAWFYATKLVAPVGLVFIYPRWEIDPQHAAQYLWPLSAATVPAALWLSRSRFGRGPFVAVAAYALLLAPASGFFDVYFFVYSWVQDHFQYFASMAALALVGAGLTTAARRTVPPAASAFLAAAVVATLGGLTWQRAAVFESSETLYRDTLARNPGAWMAHHNLGNWLIAAGQLEQGLQHLEAAVRLFPESAEGQQSLGAALLKLGRPVEALAPLSRALEIRPAFTDARHGRCHAFAELGRLDEARRDCERLVADAPEDPMAQHKLGQVLMRAGQLESAAGAFAEAVRLAPTRPELRSDLGLARVLTGDPKAAEAELREALRLDPTYLLARHRLGLVLLESGRAAEAVPLFEAVLAADPSFAPARAALARAKTGTFIFSRDEAREPK